MKKSKGLQEQIEASVVAAEAPVPELSARVEKSKVRSKNYVIDLRIHSPTSLGYLGIEGIDTAPALVRLAKAKGLDMIAVTDYFSAEFVDRIVQASSGTSVTVIPGVTLRCNIPGCNDVVLACLFPLGVGTAQIHEILKELKVPASAAGDKNFIVSQPLTRVLELLDQSGGVALPSRMDKTPYRRAAIPALVDNYGFRAFDLAYYPDSISFFKGRWPKTKFQLLSFSNAYALAQVGSRISKVKMTNPGFEGIRDLVGRAQA